VPLVATNDCHYLLPTDHTAHEILVCIHTGKTINNRGRMTYTPEHYLKSGAEMKELFHWSPEAVENSQAVADLCEFTFEEQPNHMPDFPVPEGYNLNGYFEKVARDGFEMRMQAWKRAEEAGRLRHSLDVYRQRLDRELKVIQDMGFPGYFLITWDFIRYARESDIPVGPGRGSAAGSLVAYCMQITDIDPMEYDLLFERFLNPERVSMPDVDIDFCFRKRERVIEYVNNKYGRPNVAQIITFGSMAARAVVRDVGRVMEIGYGEVDKIAKLIPNQPGESVTLQSALNDVPELKNVYENDPIVQKLIDVGMRLEGLCRHASTHAAGVVIAPKPIDEFAPLYKGTNDGD
jgi:DNA polymerase-3 subunit alpha